MGRHLKVVSTAAGNYLTGVVIDEDLLCARHPGANINHLLRTGAVVVTDEHPTEIDFGDLTAPVMGELRGPRGPLSGTQDDPNAGAPPAPGSADFKAVEDAIAEHEDGQDNPAHSTNAVHDPFRDRNVPLGKEPTKPRNVPPSPEEQRRQAAEDHQAFLRKQEETNQRANQARSKGPLVQEFSGEDGPETIVSEDGKEIDPDANPNDELPPVTGVREVEIAPPNQTGTRIVEDKPSETPKPTAETDKPGSGSTRPDKDKGKKPNGNGGK
jgi:hypothetical protein